MTNNHRENEFINLIKAMVPTYTAKVQLGIGDDAALLRPSDKPLACCQDLLVEGTHFQRSWSTLSDIGWKSMAVNLSDFAACGAKGFAAQVSIGIPQNFSIEEFTELYSGILSAASTYQIDIVGGDITKAPILILDVSLFGHPIVNFVKRSTAQSSHGIYISGELGLAARALKDFQNRIGPTQFSQFLTRPTPRCDLADFISQHATSAIDISDGLGNELLQLCQSSKLTAQISTETLSEKMTLYDQLWGGEDYQLLFTLPEDFAVQLLPAGCKKIGQMTSGPAKVQLFNHGKLTDSFSQSQSYQH